MRREVFRVKGVLAVAGDPEGVYILQVRPVLMQAWYLTLSPTVILC